MKGGGVVLSVDRAVVEGNGGDGCSGTEVAGDGVREGCGSGQPTGIGVIIKSIGGGEGCGVRLAGGSRTGSVGTDQGWDCDPERNGWTSITS